MQKIIAATILGVGLWAMAAKPAAAADFYFAGSSDMDHITILDPSTISSAPDGHKIFHLAEISEMMLWNDTTIEVDCGGNRARMTSIVTHLGGDSVGSDSAIDVSSHNTDVNVWHALVPGSGIDGVDLAEISDLVCKYPGQKPAGDMVLDFPDFQSALERVSTMIEKKQKDN